MRGRCEKGEKAAWQIFIRGGGRRGGGRRGGGRGGGRVGWSALSYGEKCVI